MTELGTRSEGQLSRPPVFISAEVAQALYREGNQKAALPCRKVESCLTVAAASGSKRREAQPASA